MGYVFSYEHPVEDIIEYPWNSQDVSLDVFVHEILNYFFGS